MTESATDVARAARFAAAISADDKAGAKAILEETQRLDGPVGLCGIAIALAVRHAQICAEYYDTDCQQILDLFAMEAMNNAENAEE